MKLKHIEPCKECPWRKCAPAGWLGGNDPYTYADMVQFNTASNCHMHPKGEPVFCAGSLAVLNNSCTAARYPEGAEEAAEAVGTREDCFQWVKDFYEHHSGGKPYVHAMSRAIAAKERGE